MPLSRPEFIARCFIALAIVLLPILVWYLFDVIMIAVAALLICELLGMCTEQIGRRLRLPAGVALALSGLAILAIVAGMAYLFGSRMISEFQDVMQRAQSGQGSIISSIQESQFGKRSSTPRSVAISARAASRSSAAMRKARPPTCTTRRWDGLSQPPRTTGTPVMPSDPISQASTARPSSILTETEMRPRSTK